LFNNIINKYDLLAFQKGGLKSFSKVVNKIKKGHLKKVEDAWKHTDYPANNWWDIPEVQYRWNSLITGDKSIEYYDYISEKYLVDRKNLLGLSLGCGTGHRVLKWANQGKFKTIEAIDLSKHRIEKAKKEAQTKGQATMEEFLARKRSNYE